MMADDREQLLSSLRKDDPTCKAPRCCLSDENAPLFGEALQENKQVTKLVLVINELSLEGDCSLVSDFIENSPALMEIEVAGNGGAVESTVTDRFLRAASRSPGLKKVTLTSTRMSSGSFSSLVSRTKSVTYLDVSSCVVETSTDGVQVLELAFRENRTLEILQLVHARSNFVIPLMQGLQDHPSLKLLLLVGSFPPGCSSELRRLLESSTSLQHLHLSYMGRFNRQRFEPIVRGLNNSQSLVRFSVRGSCEFDEESTELFEKIFGSPRHISVLTLYSHVQFAKPREMMLASMLRQPKTNLREVELRDFTFSEYREFSKFTAAMQENSTLESLVVDNIDHVPTLLHILRSLPSSRQLRKLQIGFGGFNTLSCFKADLFRALKRNSSLKEIIVQAGFLTKDDQKKLQSFAERNKTIHRYLESPADVPLELLPRILRGASDWDDGARVVDRFLIALGDTVGPQPERSTNKRKHEEMSS
jgi:hypothetical protein